jgi:hypothetical protein
MPMPLVDIDKLLVGAIDMHLHPGPDAFKCRVDALEAASLAKQVGMRALVVKTHYYPSAPLAMMVNQLVPDFKTFGSLCLDHEMGGLNVYAVEYAGKTGAKVIWMPTFSSANSCAKMRGLGLPVAGEGFSILGKDGKLVPSINPILKVVKKYDMVVASGHMSPTETIALEAEARNIGIKKFVVTHPLDHEFFDEVFTKEHLVKLAQNGAYIECTFLSFLSSEFRHDPAEMVDVIRTVGAERCIMSTDLGQSFNPLPVEGLRMFIVTLLKYGITSDEISIMIKTNPAKLLGLEA